MRLGAGTKLAGVVGHPVGHSLSPAMHNAAYAEHGLDWVYLAFDVNEAEMADAIAAMRTLDIAGLSVTMPDKQEAARLADEATPIVEALGAANCLTNDDGTIRADNTDGAGFLEGLADDAGISPAGAHVAVIGAGGAARAVAFACASAGADRVSILNRSSDRAHACAAIAAPAGVVADESVLPDVDIVVQATPVGMLDDDAVPFDVDALSAKAVVVDLVYEPPQTPLLTAAADREMSAHNGLSMLVHQAAVQFTTWTGLEAPIDVMRAAVADPFDRPGSHRG